MGSLQIRIREIGKVNKKAFSMVGKIIQIFPGLKDESLFRKQYPPTVHQAKGHGDVQPDRVQIYLSQLRAHR
jgi:hypothetical protein